MFGVVWCLISLYIMSVCMDKYGWIEVEMVVEEVYEGERFIEIDND